MSFALAFEMLFGFFGALVAAQAVDRVFAKPPQGKAGADAVRARVEARRK